MRKTLLAPLLLAAALSILPVPAWARETPVEPPVPLVLSPDEEELGKIQAALEELETLEKEKKDDEAELLRANLLLTMQKRRDDSFVEFIEDSLDSKSVLVQSHALRAAAAHEMKSAEKLAKKLVVRKKKKRRGDEAAETVVAAAIDYLARMDVKGAEDAVVEDHLPEIYISETNVKASWAPDMLRACIHYIGKRKVKGGVKLLIEMIERPEPANPNSPTNPPASYWQARHELWAPSEAWVRWALKEITGEEFRTGVEWKLWYDENEKEFD